jgi:hypothetical protein
LDDPETLRRHDAAGTAANQKALLLSDVSGCQQVMAALRGERAQVGARFASELGKGRVLFVAGKLVNFTLTVESPYADVVADMKRRFGRSGHKYARHQDGMDVEGMRWNVGGMIAQVFKLPHEEVTTIVVGYANGPAMD